MGRVGPGIRESCLTDTVSKAGTEIRIDGGAHM